MRGSRQPFFAIVVEALIRVSKRALHRPFDWVVALVAFAALFVFAVPFPLIVIAAACLGYAIGRPQPLSAAGDMARSAVMVPLWQTARTVGIWLTVLDRALGALRLRLRPGPRTHQHRASLFEARCRHLRGAYAVLSYLAQTVSQTYGMVIARRNARCAGLGGNDAGPLILVTEFVAVIAGMRYGGEPPLLMGMLAAAVALWSTFVPCFLWIFAGAPYLEWIAASQRLRGALHFVTAAVVGVIANLSLWFTLHVLFANVPTLTRGPLHIAVPDVASVRPELLVLAILAAVLLFGLKAGMATTLAVSAVAGMAYAVASGTLPL